MLSISGAMSAGDGLTKYFTGSEDYYLSAPGQWQGTGAAALELSGKVTKEQFKLVAGGFSPVDGKQLVVGKEIIDTDTNNTKYRKQAGNDLTFSADKSISIAAIVDPQIKELHEKAVAKVVDHIEGNNVQARQQVNGHREIKQTGKLVAAKFTHMTSRELDPQLHTHVFVFNMTQRQDGEWRALINRTMFQDKMALGKYYRNELAHGLQEAGYELEVTDRKQGFFRIQGVPQELEEHFSKRRTEIEAKVKDPAFRKMIDEKYPNANKSTVYQIATLGTRAAKKKISGQEIKEHWKKEIENKEYTFKGIKASIQDKVQQKPKAQKEKQQLSPKNTIDYAVQTITETDSVFTKSLILKTAADLNFGKHSLRELDKAFHSSKSLRKVGREHGREFYTSKEMLQIEQDIITAAKSGKRKRQPLATLTEVKATIESRERKNGWSYTQDQQEAIKALATAPDKVIIIQGDAGTGKTASMDVFKKLADSKGYTVRGLGFTGKSADELEKGAGIQSQTIDSFLIQNRNKIAVSKGKEVWLVDEASITGSRHFSAILKNAEKTDATVAFVGDTKQFESIAAGKIFHDLQQTTGIHVQMKEVMRQETTETKTVATAFNRGDTEKAFSNLLKQGNLKEYKNENDLRRAAVQQYRNAAKERKDIAVIAVSNNDRRELNKEIKSELVHSGIVKEGKDHTVLTPHNVSPVQAGLASSYEKGQTIQVTKSFDRLKGGQSGQVTDIDHDKNTITIKAEKKEHTISIREHHSNLTFYRNETINLSKGDKIAFLKNDKKLGVKNGQTGTIKQIDSKGNITVGVDKKTVQFSISDKGKNNPSESAKYTYKYIDHGMALTVYKSQGATVDNVIWFAPAKTGKDKQLDKRAAYVAATRAKQSFKVLTNDIKNLKKAVKKTKGKRSIFDLEKDKLKALKDAIKRQQKQVKSNDISMGL